ncbi:MFS transporter [Ligilactobacillus equi]|uniref:Sugar transport protein n=1 Tax=Ligilactobacillus equi DPC 6820 TaxID=1392007 RepID=V7HVH1_9LACO|nr:MFS transporter [Ligilactobacillus equi]ETA73265.1 sugar transport protein [Ligilactobacillus equi DPC 6820]
MVNDKELFQKYRPLAVAAGIGSILGSGVIVGLSSTITVWQSGLGMTNAQVGIISAALTFAIAIGGMLSGSVSKNIGLVKSFNWLNLIYAIGALICVFAPNYMVLLLGVIVTGLASGADLPISLTIISHDAPNEKVSASLVSSTQIYWQIGIFISYICSFVVSKMSGAAGARIVFGLLAVIAIIAWLWRTNSKTFREFHEEGNKYQNVVSENTKSNDSVIKQLFMGTNKSRYMGFFLGIFIFYICWNLLANTFGQFQTFTLVQAHASQTFATGAGIVLNFVGLIAVWLFSSVASSPNRNRFFIVGMIIQAAAMFGLAISNSALWPIVIAIGCYNMGNNIAGEAIYKVWTQESFPVETRASIQGMMNGISRFACGLFAFVTPALVVPSMIRYTMYAFTGLVIVAFIAGIFVIRLQKKYGIIQDAD